MSNLREELEQLIGQCPSAARLWEVYQSWYTTGESESLERELARAREKLSSRLHLMRRAEEELRRAQRGSSRRHQTAQRRYDEREAHYLALTAEADVLEALGWAKTAFQNRSANRETLRGIATHIRVLLSHASELLGKAECLAEPLRLAA